MSVAAGAVLEDAVVVGLGTESVHLGSGNIDVLLVGVVVVVASVVLGEDFLTMSINTEADGLGKGSGSDGCKEGEDLVHG